MSKSMSTIKSVIKMDKKNEIKQNKECVIITWIKGPSSSMSNSVCKLLSSIANNKTLSRECSERIRKKKMNKERKEKKRRGKRRKEKERKKKKRIG